MLRSACFFARLLVCLLVLPLGEHPGEEWGMVRAERWPEVSP